MTSRVALTGMGLVSPYGMGMRRFQTALLGGETALRPITRFVSDWCRHAVAGEVPQEGADMVRLKQRWLDAAVAEALTQAQWPMASEGPLMVYTTVAGGPLATSDSQGPGQGWVQDILPPRAARSAQLSVAAACASAAAGLTVARDLLLTGQADAVMVAGVEVLNPFDWASLEVLRATSRSLPRPFDKRRDGVLLAEGAGAILLETAASARQRHAQVLAWLDGAAAAIGGFDMVGPERELMARCMATAINMAGGPPDYVQAHATATRSGDTAESLAIVRAVGSAVPVSSHKGAIGHGLRVSGFFGVAAALAAMDAQAVPPTANLEEPDPECAVRHVLHEAVPAEIRRVLVNNFGFGGNYTALLLSRPCKGDLV